MQNTSASRIEELDQYYPYPNNLVDLFEEGVRKWPDNRLFGTKIAGADRYEWVTYAQVAGRVDNLRGALSRLGLKKGEKVGVIVSNCVEWFVCENAVHGLGGVFVPMYEKELHKTWEYMLRDAGVRFLFVRDEAIREAISGLRRNLPALQEIFVIYGQGENTLSALEEMGSRNPVEPYKPHWSETACIIYTSGTTGEPKGVLLHHGSLAHNAQVSVEEFYLTPDMGVVSILPWVHSFGLSADLHTYICCGGSIAFAQSVEKLLENFQEVRPTGLSAVPRVFNKIYDNIQLGLAADPVKKQFFDAACAEAVKNRDLEEKTQEFKDLDALVFAKVREIFGGQLKLVVTGGALMKPEIALFFRDIGMPTFDCYGMTETGPGITLNSPRAGNRYGTVGKPTRNMYVVIDKSRVGEDSHDGEIVVYGAHVMQGYHNKPEATAEVMTSDTYKGWPGVRTGDRGWLDGDGFLHITGRFKDQYKLENGKYIHPEAIENDIKIVRYVANTLVYGDGMPYNVAIVVPDFQAIKADPRTTQWAQGSPEEMLKNAELTDFLSSEISDYLRKSFAGYEIPQKYLFISEDFTVENGLLTQTMKLVRRRVLERYEGALRKLYEA